MQNSKKNQISCNQFELFKDKKFQFIPSLKQVKIEQVNDQEQVHNESSAEDIFEQMGNKGSNQDQQKQTCKENNINKNDDWKSYYNSRLKILKLERPELNHNQMTQLISEEWKIIKKQFKKVPSYLYQDEDLLCKRRLKQIKDNSKLCQDIIFKKQESDDELDLNPFECAKFIENLKLKKFKLVINDLTYELPGIAIIEAVDHDSVLIYLNQNNNILDEQFFNLKGKNKYFLIKFKCNNNITNTNTTQGTPNEKVNANLEDIGSDSEQSIYKGNDDFILQNNIRSFL